MNLKTISLNIAVAAVATTGIALAVSSPAEAIALCSRVDFGWAGILQETSADFKPIVGFSPDAGFGEFFITKATGDFSVGGVAPLTPGVIKDLPSLTATSSFLKFGSFEFDLSSISYFNDPTTRGYTFSGFFADGTSGIGSITTQLGLNSEEVAYSARVTAVPTPALLPGLAGLALGVARKRKAKAEAVAEA